MWVSHRTITRMERVFHLSLTPTGEAAGHRLTGLSGPRALLVMAAHPVAFAGFFAHTGALDDPYGACGHREGHGLGRVRHQARRRTGSPRGSRRAPRVHGELPADAGPFPAGTPYRATTPSCCCGSSPRWPSRRCSSSGKYVRTLSRDELNALWRDYRVVGRRSACASARCRPTSTPSRPTWPHVRERRPRRHPAARELAVDIVLKPAGPPPAAAAGRAGEPDHGRPAARVRPAPVRLPLGPVRAAAVHGGAEYVARRTPGAQAPAI